MKRHSIRFITVACTLLVSGTALAHSGHHEAGSFLSGVMHPLLGVDHVLALLAIGLWSAKAAGRRRWLPALIFLCTLAGGAALAMQGFVLPGIEAGIAASVLVGGLLLMILARLNPVNSAALITLFALFHGQAHGLEMPAAAAPFLYGLGLLLTSGLLLLLAVGLGGWIRHSRAEWSLRGAGMLSGVAGAWFLLGA